MPTHPHDKYSKRRDVLTMANPSLPTDVHRCCEARKVPLRNSSDSWLISSPRRHPQAQPFGPASRNSPNDCQKHWETSTPHTRPSGVTKRRCWLPGPVQCSWQPPARASMVPPRSPVLTRLAWAGVKFPPCAPPAELEGTRQPLPAE